jgi:hypothetical protein
MIKSPLIRYRTYLKERIISSKGSTCIIANRERVTLAFMLPIPLLQNDRREITKCFTAQRCCIVTFR